MVGRQLRFHFARKRYYISTGYPDTPQHRKLAKLKASEIEKDILYERFDPKDLGKYKSEFDNRDITPSFTPSVSQQTLPQLWENIRILNVQAYHQVLWQRIILKLLVALGYNCLVSP